MRGSDVVYNPVAIAYAVVTPDEAVLHIDRGKLDAPALAHLRRTARIEPYAAIRRTLRGLARRKAAVWVDPETTSLMCARLLDGAKPVLAPSPIARMKARKAALIQRPALVASVPGMLASGAHEPVGPTPNETPPRCTCPRSHTRP